MNIVTLDFETYFDSDYSLKKMTAEAYVRDPRFKALGCAIRGEERSFWFSVDDLPEAFAAIDWSSTACLCHHAHFDGLILSHHYGVRPHAFLDTLSMARLLVGNHLSVGLEPLARHFGLAAKNVPYDLFKGKHWHDLDSAAQLAVSSGALHDVELTWQILNILAPDFPAEEYPIVDMTVRMFTEPTLLGDVADLGAVWTGEAKKKRELLAALNLTADALQSSASFVRLLEAEGITVPTKEGKAGPVPCIAKTDSFMKELLEVDNYRVRALAEARLGVRSTLNQTRAERLGWMVRRG